MWPISCASVSHSWAELELSATLNRQAAESHVVGGEIIILDLIA